MSRYGAVDLHLHTTYSDGKNSPTELVRQAEKLDFTAIGITDHDTVAGIDEATEAAVESGKGLRVIPGVEMSSFFAGREVHILGLFIDGNNKALQETLLEARKARKERVHKIVEKLAEQGVDVKAEEVFELADMGKGAVGRLHVAEVLMKHGATSSVGQSFQKYLGPASPAYVAKWYPEPGVCCRQIHEAGGVSVLAHPGETVDRELVEGLVAEGLRAIEAFYPTYSSQVTQGYLDLARELDLGVSGGSDCHGRRKDVVLLGTIRLPEDVVRDLEGRAGVRPTQA